MYFLYENSVLNQTIFYRIQKCNITQGVPFEVRKLISIPVKPDLHVKSLLSTFLRN